MAKATKEIACVHVGLPTILPGDIVNAHTANAVKNTAVTLRFRRRKRSRAVSDVVLSKLFSGSTILQSKRKIACARRDLPRVILAEILAQIKTSNRAVIPPRI
jgi:hypothetical protein